MNKREGKGKGPPSRDLMVCFPRRAHLTLMPKPVSSSPRRRPLHFHHHQNHLRKSMRGGGAGGGHASPYLKQISSDNLSEPTSPKVTCAGQIKVRPSTRSCKNWQTVMEEIERLHDSRKKKPTTWVATLGFKREVMQFLTCLRRIKFDFSCLGGFSNVDITSDDDEDEEGNNNRESYQDQDQDHHEDNDQEKESQTVFSKWFMVLQENQDCGVFEKDEKSLKPKEMEDPHCLPPTNALLLMRCRSAPAKSWQEDKQQEEDDHDDDKEEEEEEEEEEDHDHDKEEEEDHDHDKEEEEEEEDHDHDKEEEEHVEDDDDEKKNEKKENKRKSLMELMKNEGDFYKLSCDIAKETWLIGGIHKDPFSRSRSWKR